MNPTKPTWEAEFDERARKRIGCCGGDTCTGDHNEDIKSFIKQTLSQREKEVVENILKVLNRLEIQEDRDSSMESWKMWKHVRNAIRDSLTPPKE